MTRSLLAVITLAAALPLVAAPPTVGEKAPDFKLSTVAGKSVELSEITSKGPTALVVLRGYPGYQCPFCNRQVQDLIQKSQKFSDMGVRVLLVYPGPPKDLDAKANEFMTDKQLPSNFTLVLDPGYEFTNKYGLRWDAARETAYPSTFLIDSQGTIFFSKIAKLHGGRTSADEILDAMPKPKPAKS